VIPTVRNASEFAESHLNSVSGVGYRQFIMDLPVSPGEMPAEEFLKHYNRTQLLGEDRSRGGHVGCKRGR
jgi:hypothetical protein